MDLERCSTRGFYSCPSLKTSSLSTISVARVREETVTSGIPRCHWKVFVQSIGRKSSTKKVLSLIHGLPRCLWNTESGPRYRTTAPRSYASYCNNSMTIVHCLGGIKMCVLFGCTSALEVGIAVLVLFVLDGDLDGFLMVHQIRRR